MRSKGLGVARPGVGGGTLTKRTNGIFPVLFSACYTIYVPAAGIGKIPSKLLKRWANFFYKYRNNLVRGMI